MGRVLGKSSITRSSLSAWPFNPFQRKKQCYGPLQAWSYIPNGFVAPSLGFLFVAVVVRVGAHMDGPPSLQVKEFGASEAGKRFGEAVDLCGYTAAKLSGANVHF